MFEDLKAFTAHLDNFGSLRRAMQTLADEWGPPGQGSTSSQRFTRTSLNKGKTALHGTIPFLGLFLRDLAVTNELPTYLDPTAPSTPAAKGGEDTVTNEDAFTGLHALPVDVPLRPLVNVHKHRTLAAVVQKVLVFQEMAGLYTYEADPTLFRKCLAIRCVSLFQSGWRWWLRLAQLSTYRVYAELLAALRALTFVPFLSIPHTHTPFAYLITVSQCTGCAEARDLDRREPL